MIISLSSIPRFGCVLALIAFVALLLLYMVDVFAADVDLKIAVDVARLFLAPVLSATVYAWVLSSAWRVLSRKLKIVALAVLIEVVMYIAVLAPLAYIHLVKQYNYVKSIVEACSVQGSKS